MGFDEPVVMRMQLRALIRAAAENGRPLTVMFPFVAQYDEFKKGRDLFYSELKVCRDIWRKQKKDCTLPKKVEVGAMLEIPSLAFAPKQFFEMADFISIGGNDLKQFFFAADRENERVRRRYDTLNVSYLTLIEQIVDRCAEVGTRLSFCGEDAGRPIEAMCFAAMGLRSLSMRPASIGPVKNLLRRIDLSEAKSIIDAARASGSQSVREAVMEWLSGQSN